MHTHVQPCYRPTMLGSMGLTPNDRFLAQVYLMLRGGQGGAPSLACVAPHAAASAADDMVYNLVSACKRPGRANYLRNSKVDFCRSFIFPRRTAVNTRMWCRVAGPEELRATKLVDVALCRLSFASLCLECLSSEPLR